ncbi:hypothetical protein ATK36_5032 [Amycolatopsis sulphurea]|uniref:Uncharacterized protein n=1 Tax=Amycolatopsis sulphurea TaxID=76022 RepID=A0A2A9FHD1_9PSEU|nr:hypothetical protein ATK36_5032 [Amycolatopsis sulphurea]
MVWSTGPDTAPKTEVTIAHRLPGPPVHARAPSGLGARRGLPIAKLAPVVTG